MQNLSSVDKLTSSAQIHKTSFGIIYIALIFDLCYAARGIHYVKKSFIKRTPGANVIKLFTAVSYDFLMSLSLASVSSLVHCLWAKPGAYLRVEHLEVSSIG
jgi:hypothetical protein